MLQEIVKHDQNKIFLQAGFSVSQACRMWERSDLELLSISFVFGDKEFSMWAEYTGLVRKNVGNLSDCGVALRHSTIEN